VAEQWPARADALDGEQRRLAALTPSAWLVPEGAVAVAGVFLAFARGEQGPGRAGDRGWAAAAVVDCPSRSTRAFACVPCVAGAAYEAGRMALREGPALAAAVRELPMRPDVLMVDATGRDHPRRAGLALHLGALLGLPSIGVTHRPLRASGAPPADIRGATSALTLDGEVVGFWLRTHPGARPVAVHAGWRTDPETAVRVAMACSGLARTPEPLRRARVLARTTRAHAEGRTAQAWRDPLATL
jgi:deoxyribonuclease V